MSTPRRHLAAALVLTALALIALWRERSAAPGPRSPVRGFPGAHSGAHPGGRERPAGATRESRRQMAEALKARFLREQVRAELDLQQRRYGEGYWQSELGNRQLLELDEIRAAMLKRLNAEANAALDAQCPGEAGDPIVLPPLFGADRPGPNVTFLSPPSREKLERLIADQSASGPVDAARLLDAARQVLPPDEMAAYQQWNAPEAALRRGQLVGFNATEDEFNAIAQWPNFVNAGAPDGGEDAGAELALADRIGVERTAELIQPARSGNANRGAGPAPPRTTVPLDQVRRLAGGLPQPGRPARSSRFGRIPRFRPPPSRSG